MSLPTPRKNIMPDTTLAIKPEASPAGPSVMDVDEEKVFKKPQKIITRPDPSPAPVQTQSVSLPDTTEEVLAALPPPELEPVAAKPPKKKRVVTEKMKAHMTKMRALAAEKKRATADVNRQKRLEAAQKKIEEDKIIEQNREVLLNPKAHMNIDYDKITDSVANRIQTNSRIDEETLAIIAEDIRKEERASARKELEDGKRQLQHQYNMMSNAHNSLGVLKGTQNAAASKSGRPTNRVFARSNNFRRPQTPAPNPYDSCFSWNP